VGTDKAEIKCMGPLSFATANTQPVAIPPISIKDVSGDKTAISPIIFLISSASSKSPFPQRIKEVNRYFSYIFVPISANFTGSHLFDSQPPPGTRAQYFKFTLCESKNLAAFSVASFETTRY
jgi:hypothetical protein